ncbi:MAG: Rieske 2Fe-2S domain-containing protein [Acidimicrobiales bacterium]
MVPPMRILVTGHAGLFVEAKGRTLLCDPWFNGAYFGSWFPFPDNSGIDLDRISSPDYLYVSHLHKDHFDARFLSDHVDKAATVLLPDFPMDDLRRALEALGFSSFVQTTSGRPTDLDGLRVAIATSTSVADGPIGDSALVVDDGATRILNQNDCHPRELGALRALGPYDAHFLQYSGAIWYPMVYRWDASHRAELSRAKRVRQGRRAMHFVREIGAAHVVPFAGPPAFLDEALFDLNDLDDDPTNIFQDQPSFLRTLESNGIDHGHLAVAGSEIEIAPGRFEVRHHTDVESIFRDKHDHLTRYRARRRAEIAAALPRATAAPPDPDEVVRRLAGWIEPLLADAPSVRRALGGTIMLDVGRFGIVIDPESAQVRRATPLDAGSAGHGFFFAEELLRTLVEREVDDWVNELFLSCRFEATRQGEYNEVVFSFFKCLSSRKMAYLEASLELAARRHDDGAPAEELWLSGDYLVQRRCPHLGADLLRFGHVEDGILTCSLHGNRYDLATGRCLTAEGFDLFTVRAGDQDRVEGR